MAFDSLSEKLQNVFKNLRSKGKLTEDDLKDAEKELQNITDKKVAEIDKLVAEKEKEIMEI